MRTKKKFIKCLRGLTLFLKDKGGRDGLVMFLSISGIGATGKSELIKVFVEFVEDIRVFFDCNYDSDFTKVAAYTGTATCEIPNG